MLLSKDELAIFDAE